MHASIVYEPFSFSFFIASLPFYGLIPRKTSDLNIVITVREVFHCKSNLSVCLINIIRRCSDPKEAPEQWACHGIAVISYSHDQKTEYASDHSGVYVV